MNVGRFIFTHGIPLCLQCLLNNLMAHECNVEPALCVVQVLSHAKVFVSYIKPVCYFVCCHIVVLNNFSMQIYEIIMKVVPIFPTFYILLGKNPRILCVISCFLVIFAAHNAEQMMILF